jgi:hypothetical protein
MPREWSSIGEVESQKVRPSKMPKPKMPTLEEITAAVNKGCTKLCGKPPATVTDCSGVKVGNPTTYSCKIRQLSDNITFALDQRWNYIVMEYYRELEGVTK